MQSRNIVLSLALLGLPLYAVVDRVEVEINPLKTSQPPELDGVLNEPLWRDAQIYTDFETVYPDYGAAISEETIARIAYDEEYIYVGIEAFDREPEKIRANISKWDELFNDDFVGVIIDGLGDSQSAYGFVVNGVGSQGDLLFFGNDDSDPSSDFIWDAAAQLNDMGYTVEMRIPFKSLRFEAGETVSMGIQFGRTISRTSEVAFFPANSPDAGSQLSQMATVTFKGLTYQRTYEFLPAVTQSSTRVLEGNRLVTDESISGGNLGLTGKLGLTSALTLDLTYKPDFSQVESDAGQIDANTRFALFFPEKRPFFLEGADNFNLAAANQSSGIWTFTHTRTIESPLVGGKVTGKIGNRNTIAVMFAADEAPGFADSTNRRATVGILRYKRLFGKENYLGAASSSRLYGDGANHVAALDGFWRINGNTSLESNVVVSSHSEEAGRFRKPEYNGDVNITFSNRVWFVNAGLHAITENFVLENGFTPILGINTATWLSMRTFYFQSPLLQFIRLGTWGFVQHYTADNLTERTASIFINFAMPRSTVIGMGRPISNTAFEGQLWDTGSLNFFGESQPHKMLSLNWSIRFSASPNYDPDDLYQGDLNIQNITAAFQPTDQLTLEVTSNRQIFSRRSSGAQVFDIQITRAKLTYQINKYVALRGIAEGNTGKKSVTTDLLASLTYFPGSVVFVGYGSLLVEPDDPSLALIANRYQETRRGLFFKASYNWRI